MSTNSTAMEHYAYHCRRSGARVSAMQFTPTPPAGEPPPWAAAANMAGLLIAAPEGLRLMTPRGWRTLELGEWMVHEPGQPGVSVVSAYEFEQFYSREPAGA